MRGGSPVDAVVGSVFSLKTIRATTLRGAVLGSVSLLGLALSAGILTTPALAQAQAAGQGSETIVLDTITLLGTGMATEVMTNPASISVLEGKALERSPPVSIASLMRDVPGVQINEEGIERISIRGETSRRVAILIDGQALTDHTNYGQPVLVDPTTVERIEVVRGSSSVVSGSRAIGGVINIITKKGADKPLSVTTTAGYMSATRGYRASVTASGTLDAGPGKFDYRLSLGRMKQDDRRTPDGKLDPSDVDDRNLSGHVGYRLGDHYFGAKAQRYDLSANVYVGQPNFLISLPHRDLRKVGLFYEGRNLTSWLTGLNVDVYRQTIDREFKNDVTTAAGRMTVKVLSTSFDKQTTYGANLRTEMTFSENSRTMVGLQYEDDSLVADKVSVTTMSTSPLPRTSIRYDDGTIRTLSAFAQHEVALTDSLTATVGGRWYDVEAKLDASRENGRNNPTLANSDRLGLGSVGLVWSPDEALALRANVSQGYIYPTLGQLFLTTTAGGQTIAGNPNLEPERATTFEIGARFDRSGAVIDATLFYTNAKDYIATVMNGSIGSYQNVDTARAWGLELLAEHRFAAAGLTPYVSLTAMQRELHYANGLRTRDSGTPTFDGRIGLRKDWDLNWGQVGIDAFVRGESGADYRNDAGVISGSSDGYATLNLRTHLALDNGLSLTAELANLTNRRYAPYGEMEGAGRSINLFATAKF